MPLGATGLQLEWEAPRISGKPPGPCNMHTADYFASLRRVLVLPLGEPEDDR